MGGRARAAAAARAGPPAPSGLGSHCARLPPGHLQLAGELEAHGPPSPAWRARFVAALYGNSEAQPGTIGSRWPPGRVGPVGGGGGGGGVKAGVSPRVGATGRRRGTAATGSQPDPESADSPSACGADAPVPAVHQPPDGMKRARPGHARYRQLVGREPPARPTRPLEPMLTQLAIQWRPRSASNGLDFDADQSRANALRSARANLVPLVASASLIWRWHGTSPTA